MKILIGIAIGLSLLFLCFNYIRKKRRAVFLKNLREGWRRQKNDEYFNFSAISRYFVNQESSNQSFCIISDQTANDLDFSELFKFLDRAISKVGQQFLYKKLRTITDRKQLEVFSELVGLFQRDDSLRFTVAEQLAKLSSSDAYDFEFMTRLHISQTKKYYAFFLLLPILVICLGVAGCFDPFYFIFILPVFAVNLVLHYINKARLVYYLSGITQLNIAFQVGKNLSNNESLKGYRDTSFLQDIAKIQKKIAFIGFEKKLGSEFAELAWVFAEFLKILFNFEVLLFFQLKNDLQQRQEAIIALFEYIGELDVAMTVVALQSEDLATCTPVFVEEKKIVAKQVHHPLLKNCVANDFNMEGKSLLLTGANMSGKTSFIKTLTVNALLAETLGFCYAELYEIPFMDIQSSIKVTDGLLADTSYYLQEVLNVKSFIDVSEKGGFSLFVLDELFKGTNTVERIAAGKAVLSYLNNENSIVLVSTHDVELARLLEAEGYQLHCFDEKVQDGKILFSYKLKEGIPQEKNAIKILELYGYPSELVAEAKSLT